MFNLLSLRRDSDDLSIVFDRSRDRRKRELNNIKTPEGKYHLRLYLKDIFGFAEHRQIGTFGLGYKLILTRNTDNAVLNEDNATSNAKNVINYLEWPVPHYVPIPEKYDKFLNEISKKTPTNLQYAEKSVFMKEVNTQNFWTFELGTQEGVNVPIWIFVAFQQHDRQHDENFNNDTFDRMPVTSAQCNVGIEKIADNAILLNYDDDYYSQGYGQIKEAFKALTKDNILRPYISEDDFRSDNNGNNIGSNIHVFDIRYQKSYQSGQSVKIEFNLDKIVPAGVYGYALVLTNRLVSKSSDGQCMLDLV